MPARHSHHRHAVAIAVLSALGGLSSMPVLAQASGTAGALERVEITAEKRLTLLDTTPSAISALNGGRLAESGATGLADLVTLVPNMSFTTGYGASQLFIRGIGNVFFTAGGDPGVALYTDGAYISDQTSSNASLFDVQRVEVLRGPQGALYGRNATGGAMNLISALPTQAFKAQFGALLGQYGRRESEGFVSGGLGFANTSARLSYQVKKLDGYTVNQLAGVRSGPVLPGGVDTIGPDRLDDLDSRALRLQTLTDMGPAGTLRLIASSYRQDEAGPGNKQLVDPVTIPILLYNARPVADPRATKSQGASNAVDVTALQVVYERPLGDATLSLVASHRKSDADMFWDGDATEALMATTRFKTGSRDRSINVHVASGEGALQWLVGASWLQFDQRQDIQVDTQIPLGFLAPGQPVNVPFPGGVRFLLGGKVDTRSTAVYADLRYALSKQFAVLAGLRSSRDTKEAQEYQTVAAFGLNGTGAPSASWSSTPGSLGFEATLARDTLVYGKLSRGFKSGAINLGALQGTAVRPETVNSAELGFKTSFLERRGAFSAAVFSSKYRDMQVSQVGLASAILTNASAAKINGVELELSMRPVSALTLSATLGLMDPKYTRFLNVDLRNGPGVTVDVSGRQLAQVSKQQASLGAEWTQALGDLRAVLRADYAWRSKYYFTEFNTPDAEQAAYGTLNLGVVLRPRQGAWKAYAQLLNVGNSTAITSMNIASPVLGASRQVNYTPPRRVAVGASMDF
jgi:outer membrane receptor protein involved in Fe transport